MEPTAWSGPEEAGISPLDLLDLSLPLRRLLILLLRHREMSHEALQEAIARLAPEEGLSPEELEEALAGLVARGWLLHQREAPSSYRVRFRRLDRPASPESRRGRAEPSDPTPVPPLDG